MPTRQAFAPVKISCLLLPAVLTSACTAQQTVAHRVSASARAAVWEVAALRVRGIVTDASGRGVGGVQVVWSACRSPVPPLCDDALLPGSVSDADGRFAFDVPSNGEYQLVAVRNGILGASVRVSVPRDSAVVTRLRVRP